MFDIATVAKVLLVRRVRERSLRKKRTVYIRDIFLHRDIQGDSILVKELSDDPHYHFKYFRMDKCNFDIILGKLEAKLVHHGTHMRPIPSMTRLAITLRYLASGNSQISLAMSYRISPSSASIIIRKTLAAICDVLTAEYLPQPTVESWMKNEHEFMKKWDFPNACGAIDGKHVRVKAPKATGSLYFNYKGYFSIVLLAIAGPKYQFSAVDIGCAGSESDGGILMRSEMGKRLSTNAFALPSNKPISASGSSISQVILGDSGFPLKPNLMVPYKGEYLNKEKRIYNYRLSRARMVVENCFGILAARWRIFHTPLEGDLMLNKLIIQSAVILHNFLISKADYNNITLDRFQDDDLVHGNWRDTTLTDTGLTQIQRQGSNNYSGDASNLREAFTSYFNAEGALEWQDRYVNRVN